MLNHLRCTEFSILINGVPCNFFSPGREVKQSDPLSPLLFILASEGFSCGLKAYVVTGRLRPFRLGRMFSYYTSCLC